MATATVRQRKPSTANDTDVGTPDKYAQKQEQGQEHPGGDIKHGGLVQVLRIVALATYFYAACCSYVLCNLVLSCTG